MLDLFVVPTLVATLVLIVCLIGWWLAIDWAFKPYNPKKQTPGRTTANEKNSVSSGTHTAAINKTNDHSLSQKQPGLLASKRISNHIAANKIMAMKSQDATALTSKTDTASSASDESRTDDSAAEKALRATAEKMAAGAITSKQHLSESSAAGQADTQAAQATSRHNQPDTARHNNQIEKTSTSSSQADNRSSLPKDRADEALASQSQSLKQQSSKNHPRQHSLASNAAKTNSAHAPTAATQNSSTHKATEQAAQIQHYVKSGVTRKETRKTSGTVEQKLAKATADSRTPELVAELETSDALGSSDALKPALHQHRATPSTPAHITSGNSTPQNQDIATSKNQQQQQPKYQTAAKAKSPSVNAEASIQIPSPAIRPAAGLERKADHQHDVKANRHAPETPEKTETNSAIGSTAAGNSSQTLTGNLNTKTTNTQANQPANSQPTKEAEKADSQKPDLQNAGSEKTESLNGTVPNAAANTQGQANTQTDSQGNKGNQPSLSVSLKNQTSNQKSGIHTDAKSTSGNNSVTLKSNEADEKTIKPAGDTSVENTANVHSFGLAAERKNLGLVATDPIDPNTSKSRTQSAIEIAIARKVDTTVGGNTLTAATETEATDSAATQDNTRNQTGSDSSQTLSLKATAATATHANEASDQPADVALRAELEISKRRIATLQSTLNKMQHDPQLSNKIGTDSPGAQTSANQSTTPTRPTLLSKVRVLDSTSVNPG